MINTILLSKIYECAHQLHETQKPPADVDRRSLQVLLISMALLALCLSDKTPNSISFLGFAIGINNWLYIALPLVVVLLYWVHELFFSIRLTKMRVQFSIKQLIRNVRNLHDDFDKKARDLEEHVDSAKPVRAELDSWRDRELQKIKEKEDQLTGDDYFILLDENQSKKDEVEKKYQKKLEESGLNELAEKIKGASGHLESGKENQIHIIVENFFKEAKNAESSLKHRMLLSMFIPVSLALFSLVSLISKSLL